jgi:hypothetical protein
MREIPAWDAFILRNGPRRWVIFASFLRSWIQLTRRSQELGQANEMAGGHGEGEHGADLVEAAHLQLPEPTHRLAPAEAFLNPLAQPLADRIAGSPRPRSGRRSCASLPFLLTVPLIATCASILRAFRPWTKAWTS